MELLLSSFLLRCGCCTRTGRVNVILIVVATAAAATTAAAAETVLHAHFLPILNHSL